MVRVRPRGLGSPMYALSHIHGGVRQGFVLNPVSLNTVLEIALSSWNAKIGLHTSVGWTSG